MKTPRLYSPWIVWLLRLIVGAVFIISGFTKAIDPWGFAYKITDYLAVWSYSLPHILVVAAAIALSATEFCAGLMLLLGCFRKAAPWIITAMMAFLLPLTIYIYVAEPVDDCGCFGDAFILSNGATMLKNIGLTIAAIYLIVYNHRTTGLIRTQIQWFMALISGVYILAIAAYGYVFQPLIDFLPYPVGTDVASIAQNSETADYLYTYERNGQEKEFTIDNLPDESEGWTFVSRKTADTDSVNAMSFAIFDTDDNDVTEDILSDSATTKSLMMVLVPKPEVNDLRYAALMKGMHRFMDMHGGSMIEVIGGTPDTVDYLTDILAPEYPIYLADDTAIEQMARGNVALVYVKDGKIAWKRSALTLPSDVFTNANRHPETVDYDQELDKLKLRDSREILKWLTAGLIGIIIIFTCWDVAYRHFRNMIKRSLRNRRKKSHKNLEN